MSNQEADGPQDDSVSMAPDPKSGGYLYAAPGKLIVARDDAERVTPGGIALPDTAQDKRTTRGTVVSAGLGEYVPLTGAHGPVDYGVGDVVLFSRYAGNELEIAGVTYTVLSFSDVLAVVRPA